MTQQEFIDRTGLQVADEQFVKINAMYMASNLDKDEFCTHYTQGLEDSPIVADIVTKLDTFTLLYESAMEKRDKLARAILRHLGNYDSDKLIDVAEGILGKSAAIKYRIAERIDLTDDDLAYIVKSL